MATQNLFDQQSLMFGYSTTTISGNGRTTVNAPIANVSGLPTYSTGLGGITTEMKPTENLTGYPVYSTGSSSIFSNLDATNQLQPFGGDRYALYPSGNITGWPTVFTNVDTLGNLQYEFNIPGYAPAGSLQWDNDGNPSFSDQFLSQGSGKNSTPGIPEISAPEATTLAQNEPTVASYTGSTVMTDPILATLAQNATKRRQNSFSTLLGSIFEG